MFVSTPRGDWWEGPLRLPGLEQTVYYLHGYEVQVPGAGSGEGEGDGDGQGEGAGPKGDELTQAASSGKGGVDGDPEGGTTATGTEDASPEPSATDSGETVVDEPDTGQVVVPQVPPQFAAQDRGELVGAKRGSIYNGNGYLHTTTWDDTEAAIQQAEYGHWVMRDNPVASTWHNERYGRNAGLRWYGGVTFDEACAMARAGWPEGAERILRLAQQFERVAAENLGTTNRMTVRRRQVGARPNPAAVAAGAPAHMLDIRKAQTRKRYARLVVNLSHPYSRDPEDLIRQGAYAGALALTLERQGVQVAIDGVCAHTTYLGDRHRFADVIPIKQPGTRLDMARVAYWLAHPSSLRRIIFGMSEGRPKEERKALGVAEDKTGGYGIVTALPEELKGDINIEYEYYAGGAEVAEAIAGLLGKEVRRG